MLRATLKSLLSRKLRLVLSGMAVVLGVMAVSGALILTSTLTKGFDELFAGVYAHVDVEVTGQTHVKDAEDTGGGDPVSEPVPADLVQRIDDVPGVADAFGQVAVNGARVVGPDGKVIINQGPPTLGSSWQPDDPLFDLRSGHEPRAPHEVAINASLAERGEFELGDQIEVLTLQPKQTFELVGIFGYANGQDTIGGTTEVAFTEPVAQELMLDQAAAYSSIIIRAEDGVDAEALRDAVLAEVGDSYLVRTGEQAATDTAEDVQGFVGILQNVLLGFAGVALFVGIFLILNTFSILVTQRTGELALFRSLGASRRQVISSVLVEAVVIGLIAATIGLGAGLGIAALLKMLMESFSSASIPGPWLVVPTSAVIASYLVGILVTVVAAVLPALRASRVAPVAAMTQASTQDRPHTLLSIAGGVATLAGSALVGIALFGEVGSTMLVLFGGVLLAFVGVAMLTPAICRPVTSVLGRLASFSTAGKLGRLNSARNPRRTAITAAALMVGIALVTGVSVLASSLTKSLESLVDSDLNAELLIAGEMSGGPSLPPNFDPAVVDRAREVPGVDRVVGVRFDSAQVTTATDSGAALATAGDLAGLADVLSLTAAAGELRTLESGEVALNEDFAGDRDLEVGDPITVQTQRGPEQQLTVVGIFGATSLWGTPVVMSDADAAAGFRTAQLNEAFIQLADGADSTTVRQQLEALVAGNPEVSVQDQSDLLASAQSQVDELVLMLYILLGLALVIAILGIVNTLALSVLERTRELGLVRAIGMGRSQVMQMVTVESVVIAVFGALLGIVVGGGLGAAIVQALSDNIPELALPFGSMAMFVGLAVLIGLLAAILPSVRAARTNVLTAIAYE